MNGESKCIVCAKEFKWRRSKDCRHPKYCSLKCRKSLGAIAFTSGRKRASVVVRDPSK
jgi:hypothetical protein